MKNRDEIEARIRKLVDRYKTKYVNASQARVHRNCSFNRLHTPTGNYESNKSWETGISPRRQVTLIVLEPERPVGICMYGSEKPETWSGDTCDDDDVSKKCPMFSPNRSSSSVEEEFDDHMQDDEYVLKHYPDVAALQWAVNARHWKIRPLLIERIISFLSHSFSIVKSALLIFKMDKRLKSLPASRHDVPMDGWERNTNHDSSENPLS